MSQRRKEVNHQVRVYFGSRSSADQYEITDALETIDIPGIGQVIKISRPTRIPGYKIAGFGCGFSGCTFMMNPQVTKPHEQYGLHNRHVHFGDSTSGFMVYLIQKELSDDPKD